MKHIIHKNAATDSTYNYAQDNPIEMGGAWFDKPARKQAYLGFLSSSISERISYVRTGSLEHNDTILDAYEVSYSGAAPVILYIDEYAYGELLAPSGFICWTTIPLVEP